MVDIIIGIKEVNMGTTTYGINNNISMDIKHNLDKQSTNIPVIINFKHIENVKEDECLEVELSEIIDLVSELAEDIGEDEEFINRINELWVKAKNHFQ